MLERIAQTSPLPCYGLEQDLRTSQCLVCPHKTGCQDAMGSRHGKVPLSQASVNLELSSRPLDAEDPDEDDFIGLYHLCYQQIFRERPDRYFEQSPEKMRSVITTAHEIGCPLRLFILAVMMSHNDATPGQRFFGGRLAGPSALKRVRLYRAAAREMFGVFDPESAAQLSGAGSDQLRDSLRSSEEIAATFIVGYKSRFTAAALDLLYQDRELGLHPAWLATEPSYTEWCRNGEASTAELKRHRARVAQVDRRSWPMIAQLRAPTIVPVAGVVLARHGLRLEHVLVETPVVSSTDLWCSLGILVRQYTCMRYLRGDLLAFGGQVKIS
jgi:hypothetical protein